MNGTVVAGIAGVGVDPPEELYYGKDSLLRLRTEPEMMSIKNPVPKCKDQFFFVIFVLVI